MSVVLGAYLEAMQSGIKELEPQTGTLDGSSFLLDFAFTVVEQGL